MVDTTPEFSLKDQLTVAIRYVDREGVVRERLIMTCEAEAKTGEGMADNLF